MTDWNGNGKLDPVDVGIDIATNASDEDKSKKPATPVMQNSGCMTVFVSVFVLVLCVIFAYAYLF